MHPHPAPSQDPLRPVPANPRGTLDVLRGFRAEVSGQSGAAHLVRRHLADLGARLVATETAAPESAAAHIVVCRDETRHAEPRFVVSVSWDGGLDAGLVDERTVQAACGLMHVHGRRGGHALPIGIDYASIMAGVLAVQSVLAGLLARERGLDVTQGETSVADAALLAVSQYLANATAPQDEEDCAPAYRGEPPPFRSLEGVAFELEALDGDVWARFWAKLGVTGPLVGRAWRSFVFRYATADCALPDKLHVTTRSFLIQAIEAAADGSGASICVLRSHAQRIIELGLDGGGYTAPVWTLTGLASVAGGVGTTGVDNGLPLSGLRVIEAGRRIQAPLAGHLLRLLGARVTRIEPPGGDPLRWMAPLAGDTSARFRALNDAKEVMQVNIKDARQREELLNHAAQADVFLHNWAPGKAAQFGLDATDFADRNAAIVFAYASAWGDMLGEHPPLGTDFMVQAHAALAETLTPAGQEPAPALMTLLDIMGGLVAVEGILAALLRRQLTQQGQRVDTSLLAAATVLQADVLEAAAHDREHDRVKGRPPSGALHRPVPAADGLLWITVRDHDEVKRVARCCGLDGDTADIDEQILTHMRTRPVRELELVVKGAGLACTAVCEDLAQLADSNAPFLPALCIDGCAFVRAPWKWSR